MHTGSAMQAGWSSHTCVGKSEWAVRLHARMLACSEPVMLTPTPSGVTWTSTAGGMIGIGIDILLIANRYSCAVQAQ